METEESVVHNSSHSDDDVNAPGFAVRQEMRAICKFASI